MKHNSAQVNHRFQVELGEYYESTQLSNISIEIPSQEVVNPEGGETVDDTNYQNCEDKSKVCTPEYAIVNKSKE